MSPTLAAIGRVMFGPGCCPHQQEHCALADAEAGRAGKCIGGGPIGLLTPAELRCARQGRSAMPPDGRAHSVAVSMRLATMKAKHSPGPRLTLGNMRELKVRNLIA
jgi:hypothetical protein